MTASADIDTWLDERLEKIHFILVEANVSWYYLGSNAWIPIDEFNPIYQTNNTGNATLIDKGTVKDHEYLIKRTYRTNTSLPYTPGPVKFNSNDGNKLTVYIKIENTENRNNEAPISYLMDSNNSSFIPLNDFNNILYITYDGKKIPIIKNPTAPNVNWTTSLDNTTNTFTYTGDYNATMAPNEIRYESIILNIHSTVNINLMFNFGIKTEYIPHIFERPVNTAYGYMLLY